MNDRGGGEEVRWKTVLTYGKILATPLIIRSTIRLQGYKGDQRFTLEMYYILLSFVDCAPRPYHGSFTLLLVQKIM